MTVPDGRKIVCKATNDAGGLQIEFPEEIAIAEGKSLTVRIIAKPATLGRPKQK